MKNDDQEKGSSIGTRLQVCRRPLFTSGYATFATMLSRLTKTKSSKLTVLQNEWGLQVFTTVMNDLFDINMENLYARCNPLEVDSEFEKRCAGLGFPLTGIPEIHDNDVLVGKADSSCVHRGNVTCLSKMTKALLVKR